MFVKKCKYVLFEGLLMSDNEKYWRICILNNNIINLNSKSNTVLSNVVVINGGQLCVLSPNLAHEASHQIMEA